MTLDTVAAVATIVGAAAAVLSYVHARRKRASSDALLPPSTVPDDAAEEVLHGTRTSISFTVMCEIRPPAGGFFSGESTFRSADISSDGRLVAAVSSGRRRAYVYSGSRGNTVAQLRTRWSPFSMDGYREECLFRPRFSQTGNIAYVELGKFGVSLHQRSYGGGFQHYQHLSYVKRDDDALLGAPAWSPDGAYFGVGTYSTAQPDRTYTIWDVADAKVVSCQALNGSTEARQAVWHRHRRLVFVHHHNGGAVVDLDQNAALEIGELQDNLCYLHNVAWHPEDPVLLCAASQGIVLIDVENGTVLREINDVSSEAVTIRRQYRLTHGADYNFFWHATGALAFSPDGKLLASSDHWGNVVVRSTQDLTIQRTYWVDSTPGGLLTDVTWLPCDEAGLIMQCRNEERKLLTYYVDARASQTPELLDPLEDGEYIWGARSGVAVLKPDRIVVYAYK